MPAIPPRIVKLTGFDSGRDYELYQFTDSWELLRDEEIVAYGNGIAQLQPRTRYGAAAIACGGYIFLPIKTLPPLEL